jgi:hypothetical protein
LFEREPLPHGASWTLLRRFDPFAADDIPELMRQAGPEHQGDAAAQARNLSDAALSFLEMHRSAKQAPPGGRVAQLQKLGALARQLREAMPADPLALFPPDIGHAPPVRALCGITPGMEKENWPAVKDAARAVKEGLFMDLPHLLRLLEVASQHEAESVARRKRQGPQTDFVRHDFVIHCMAAFEDASDRPGLVVSRPAQGGARGGPAPRFLGAVCRLFLARLHVSELDEAPRLAPMLSEASRPEVAALWIEQARNIRAKLGEE